MERQHSQSAILENHDYQFTTSYDIYTSQDTL